MPIYDVQLQQADGQIVEREYRVKWDPAKVLPEEVARACAAEMTVASGGNMGSGFKMPHAGVSAVLRVDAEA